MHDWVRTIESGATRFSFARPCDNFEWIVELLWQSFDANRNHSLNIQTFSFHMTSHVLKIISACLRKLNLKICFISPTCFIQSFQATFLQVSRSNPNITHSSQPQNRTKPFTFHQSITVIVSCQVGKSKWLVIQLSTCFGKIEAYFQIKFSRVDLCVNNF